MRKIAKKLSANDLGATGSHQAGILVPKEESILSFFPTLSRRAKNPRAILSIREKPHGTRWQFNFIYYNNKLFGGTRNEYRLTGMTSYLRASNASVGDELVFSKDENGTILVECVRASKGAQQSGELLVLRSGWKSIPT